MAVNNILVSLTLSVSTKKNLQETDEKILLKYPQKQ